MASNLPRVGIGLAGVHPRDILTLAKEADEAGIYCASIGDGMSDTFAMLGAIAAVTENIRLMSSIATWTRTPLATSKACRTLDLLSDGRYILGLGSMPRVWNENHHGISGEAPLTRMREYVELVRMLWSSSPDSPVEYEGRFYRVSGYRAPEPPPRPHLTILIGASRRRMIRESGEWADGVLFNWNYVVPYLQELGLPALEEGARRSGRTLNDLERFVFRSVCVAEDPRHAEKARRAVRHHLATTYMGIDYHQELLISFGFGEEVAAAAGPLAKGDLEGTANAVSDRMVDTFSIIGTEDECRRRVAEYAPLLNGFLLYPPLYGYSREERMAEARRLIRAFGTSARL